MDVAKVARDYYISSQSSLLIPNRDFGTRKMFHVGLTRSTSAGSMKADPAPTGLQSPHAHAPTGGGGKSNSLKGLFVSSLGQNGRHKSQVVRAFSEDSSTLQENNAPVFRDTPCLNSIGAKQWLHPSTALLKGHILYTVKFLGECKVDHPKGTDVVKAAITKMKFNKHIKRAEGQKPPKVELTISVDAVKIIDPKTKVMMHQYPLHRISYCADDKSDKRMFTFIGKAADNNDHYCYVFDSEKCAEEITLTIGQAFELAYKRFIESSTQDIDLKKQFLLLQKKVNTLQFENDALKKRLAELEKLKDRSDVEQYKINNQIGDISTVKLNLRESSTDEDDSPVSYEPNNQTSVVGRRLENLILTEENASPQTNGNHRPFFPSSPTHSTPNQAGTPILSPPPPNSRPTRSSSISNSRMNAINSANTNSNINNNNNTPAIGGPSNHSTDAFGMQAFNPAPQSEQELIDIRDGFSRGLSFGTDDFNLDDLDPLNQRL